MTAATEALVRRFYEEVWNEDRLEVCDELFAANGDRYENAGRAPLSRESQKLNARMFRLLFPDAYTRVEVLFSIGEWVAARWRMSGTLATTGRTVRDYTGINLWRVQGGRIVALYANHDDLGMFQQLGYVSSNEELWQRLAE